MLCDSRSRYPCATLCYRFKEVLIGRFCSKAGSGVNPWNPLLTGLRYKLTDPYVGLFFSRHSIWCIHNQISVLHLTAWIRYSLSKRNIISGHYHSQSRSIMILFRFYLCSRGWKWSAYKSLFGPNWYLIHLPELNQVFILINRLSCILASEDS